MRTLCPPLRRSASRLSRYLSFPESVMSLSRSGTMMPLVPLTRHTPRCGAGGRVACIIRLAGGATGARPATVDESVDGQANAPAECPSNRFLSQRERRLSCCCTTHRRLLATRSGGGARTLGLMSQHLAITPWRSNSRVAHPVTIGKSSPEVTGVVAAASSDARHGRAAVWAVVVSSPEHRRYATWARARSAIHRCVAGEVTMKRASAADSPARRCHVARLGDSPPSRSNLAKRGE
mmetsp:Transcript_31951/g.75125  ORF Transcript_31951/g.75125 Transcript_31951/m.75125 type:complete len:236 (-) Transcript_31951:1818-2525(-)